MAFVYDFLFFYNKKKRLHFEELKEQQRFLKEEAFRSEMEIRENTLRHVAEEIHDNVGQVLSLAKLNLNTLEHNTEQKLQDTKQLISKAINDLRDLSRSMHGDRIAELGLQQSLTDELQILQNSGEFETHLKITGESYKLPPQKEMVIFRIVQEALHNAIKHAKAKNITLQLNYLQDVFVLNVQDDGIGFNADAAQNKGIGLKSMQNRAQLIGGTCTLQSTPDTGTSITIELPTSLPNTQDLKEANLSNP